MTGISDFLRSIGTGRLLAGLALLSLIGGGLTAAMFRLADEDMSVLFTDLDVTDASRIIEDLRGDDIAFENRSNGRTIMVPSDQVLELRMRFASEGLPARGIAGYELLDNQSALGTTSFLQNVNYVRALEGELARTISALQAVRTARVFLNLPKRELFSRESKPATASIQLDTVHGTLTGQQVRAIQFLVASAVDSLSPQRVSVIDASGNVLAAGQGEEGGALAGSVDDRRRTLESRLRTEVEEILHRIVGPGNARVRISAEMNLNRVVEETRTWDPEAQVIVSTRTVEESSTRAESASERAVSVSNNLPEGETTSDTGPNASDAENRTEEQVNYENSLTKRTEVQEAGRLERLSVAVIVNEKSATAEDGSLTYTPRTKEELASIEALVRAAVGFNERRGDQVRVVSARFAEAPKLEEAPPEPGLMDKLDINRIVEAAALVILALISFFALRPMAGRLLSPQTAAAGNSTENLPAPGDVPQLPAPGTPAVAANTSQAALPGPAAAAGSADAAAALPAPVKSEFTQAIDIAQIEGQVKESSIKKVGELVTSHPEESLSILRTWLHETA